MKKIKYSFLLGTLLSLALCGSVKADLGDFGYFGGISEGRDLPKTTELLLDDKKNDDLESVYKEPIFLTGTPTTFEGTIEVKTGQMKSGKDADTYTVDYTVKSSNSTDTETANINRKLKYDVNYRKEGSQIIKDYKVKDWSETISVNGQTYTLDDEQSKSSIGVIEDDTPGVTYYKGNLSHKAVYTLEDSKVVLEMNGTFYGYNCAYSSTETQRIDCTVTTDDWQMQYQIRPSVSLGKTLQYTQNEPTAISFSGNYQEIMQNKSGLSYNIYVLPNHLTYSVEPTGNISIDTFNTFEQLIAPDVSYVKGHFAEEDIKRMFSMKILEGDPEYYQPS